MAGKAELPIICQCPLCDDGRKRYKTLFNRCQPKVKKVTKPIKTGPNEARLMDFESVSMVATVEELAHYFMVIVKTKGYAV